MRSSGKGGWGARENRVTVNIYFVYDFNFFYFFYHDSYTLKLCDRVCVFVCVCTGACMRMQ